MSEAKRYIMNYQSIHGCRPEETLKHHQSSLSWLEAALASPDNPGVHATCIEAKTGKPPPMLQLALYFAGQTLIEEISNQSGFAKQFLGHAGPACNSLQSRYLRIRAAELMDLARSPAAKEAADSVLEELIKSFCSWLRDLKMIRWR